MMRVFGRSTSHRHPGESRDPGLQAAGWQKVWVPAFAGMTVMGGLLMQPVAAQTTGPVMGSSAGEAVAAETQAEVRQILVIGDVLGGGLGAGMTRLAEASGEGDITLRFVEEFRHRPARGL